MSEPFATVDVPQADRGKADGHDKKEDIVHRCVLLSAVALTRRFVGVDRSGVANLATQCRRASFDVAGYPSAD
jgi:hypothetical protein